MKIKHIIKAYQASNGMCYAKLDDFQRAELNHIIKSDGGEEPSTIENRLIANADRVIEVLKLSKRKTRVAGTPKPKKQRNALGRGVPDSKSFLNEEPAAN